MKFLQVHTKHTAKETINLDGHFIAQDTIAEVYKIEPYRTKENYASVGFRVRTKRGEAYGTSLLLGEFEAFIEGRS